MYRCVDCGATAANHTPIRHREGCNTDAAKVQRLEEKINLAIGGIDALCLMTDNNPGYEDFQAIKQTLEGE